MFAIAGLAKTSTENAPGLTLTGDVTGAVAGTTVSSTTLSTTTGTPIQAIAAAGLLTSSGALGAATHAVCTLTNDTTNIGEGKIITIGTTVYTFKATTTTAYDINIGASAAESLDFLKAAINASGTGDGSDYHAGTLAHPDVVATTNADTTQVIQAKVPGIAANSIVTTSDDAGWTWDGGTMNSGTPGVTTATATFTIGSRAYTIVDELSETAADAIVDQVLYGGDEATCLDNIKVAINNGDTEGTNYSTGTVVNALVTAGTNTNTTQLFTSKIAGTIGNAYATTETLANTAFDATTLGTAVLGVDATVGVVGEIRWDASYIYVCTAANTVADSNWERIPIAGYTASDADDLVVNIEGYTTKLLAGTAPSNAVKAVQTLTSSGALAAATHAVCTLTNDTTAIAEGTVVTINATSYTFKATTTEAYDINIGVSAAETTDFLKAAINASGTGDGSDYHAGTLAHPDVVATTNGDTTQVIQAKIPGVTPNAYVTESDDAGWTWDGATMNSGTPGVTTAAATITIGTRTYTVVDELSETAADAIVDQVLAGANAAATLDNLKVALNAGATAGTNYSTGTVVNADVLATTNSDTIQVIEAKVAGVAGNAIATTETLANTAWGAAVMAGGVDGTVGAAGTTIVADGLTYTTYAANTIATANWRSMPQNVFSGAGTTGYITVTGAIDLLDGDFTDDVIFLDGSAPCTVAGWQPTAGRTYTFHCIESTNDPVVNLTSGVTLNTAADDIMTFEDADDTITIRCLSATRCVIIGDIGSVTLSS